MFNNVSLTSLICFYFRAVDYINAKGTFIDQHTVKAILKNGTEVTT